MNALQAARHAVTALEQRERAAGEERLNLTIEALAYFALAAGDLQPPATEQTTVPLPITKT